MEKKRQERNPRNLHTQKMGSSLRRESILAGRGSCTPQDWSGKRRQALKERRKTETRERKKDEMPCGLRTACGRRPMLSLKKRK